jgi:hypothetical protein
VLATDSWWRRAHREGVVDAGNLMNRTAEIGWGEETSIENFYLRSKK